MDKKHPFKPPHVLHGGYSVIRSRPTVTGMVQFAYPAEFPEESRSRVAIEQICALREFNECVGDDCSEFKLRNLRIKCALRPTLAIAREAISLGWGAHKADAYARAFLEKAVIWVELATFTNGISLELRRDIEMTPEWTQYHDELLNTPKPTVRKDERVPETSSKERKRREPRPELLSDANVSLNRFRAAEALGVTTRTLDRWIKDGLLTPIGAGSRKRFRVKDLKRLLDHRSLDKRDKT